MKLNVQIIVLGVLLVLPSFAQIGEAGQVPRVGGSSQVRMKSDSSMRHVVQPTRDARLGTFQAESVKAGITSITKGLLSIDPQKVALMNQQFLANNPNDYDGDGIPNNLDVVCQDSNKRLVMLTKAQAVGPDDYIYTVDHNQNLSSDVAADNFLLRYVRSAAGDGGVVTLRSYYNPNQVDVRHDGAACVWPPNEPKGYRDVSVLQDEWRKIDNHCGNQLVRWIYHDETTDNVILQFANLTQIPTECMHPTPETWIDVYTYRGIMFPIKDSPACQDIRYDWTRYSQINYREAIATGHPVGCKIDFPIVQYIGPTQSPCHPLKSCKEASGNCASVNLDGDCSDMNNC